MKLPHTSLLPALRSSAPTPTGVMSRLSEWARRRDIGRGVLRAVWARELKSVARMQPSRIAAVAEMVRLHGFGGDRNRFERAVVFAADEEVRFASLGKTRSWLAQWLIPHTSITHEEIDEVFIPLSVIRTLAAPEARARTNLRVERRGGTVQALLTGDRRWATEAEKRLKKLAPAVPAAGVITSRIGEPLQAIRITCPQHPVTQRVKQALADAAERIGCRSEDFVAAPIEEDGYLYLGPDLVWKLRLRFIQSNKVGQLLNEWTALTRLDMHPSIVDAVSYEATPDWELLAIRRVTGRRVDEVAVDHADDDAGVDRALLRLMDIKEFADSHGIVHRDLHPENVLVDDREHLHLIDFDQAALIHPQDRPHNADLPARAEPLIPWACFEDLIHRLGWRTAWESLLMELHGVWQSLAPPKLSLTTPRGWLSGTHPFWDRWHGIVTAADDFAGRGVAVVGDNSGLLGIFTILWGANCAYVILDDEASGPAIGLVARLGLSGRVQFVRPSDVAALKADVAIVVGDINSSEREAVDALASRIDLLIYEDADPASDIGPHRSTTDWGTTECLPARGCVLVKASR